MGTAIDTILAAVVNPGAGGAVAGVANSGDTLQVRNANSARAVYLEGLIRAGATAGDIKITSPALHDNVFGIRVKPNETPSIFTLPAELDQTLVPMDTLVMTIGGGAAETDLGVLQVYYEDLPGISARLHRFGELTGLFGNVKPVRVAVVSSAVIGAWSDTVITTTEDALQANHDYAVLGYVTDTNLAAVGIKGAETGNLRICGPGTTSELVTSNYFVNMDTKNGRPWVPVINSANKGGIFVSVCAPAASVAAVVTLILVELKQNLNN